MSEEEKVLEALKPFFVVLRELADMIMEGLSAVVLWFEDLYENIEEVK